MPPVKRFHWFLPGVILTAGLIIGWWQSTRGNRLIPDGRLREAVPWSCRQLVVIRAQGVDQVPAEVWLLERPGDGTRWRVAHGPLAGVVGRNGVGWGLGA